jgi:hypothetical protein
VYRVCGGEERKHRISRHTGRILVHKIGAIVRLKCERDVLASPQSRRTCEEYNDIRPSELWPISSQGRGESRTWNDDRGLLLIDPVVRRDIARVLDRDVLGREWTRGQGNRFDDLGRVQTFLDVGPGRKVGGCESVEVAASCSTGVVAATATDVVPVSIVWPGARVAA